MIGEFLLTDNDPFLDDSQEQHWPSSLDGKTTIPLQAALHQDKNNDNDTPTHLTSILLKERGPSNASTTSSTLMAWAMSLAQHRIDRRHNCPQCHSHPETCQCNFVDLILCRPTGSLQEQQQQQEQSAEAGTSELNTTTNDTSLHPLLQQFLQQQSSTENSQRYALGRIRVHTVSTRSEFLHCILSLHHRPPTEQPRHGILVDQLEPFMVGTANSHHTIQTGSTPNHSAYPSSSSSSSFVDSVMVLSQLVALLVDTAQWTAQVQQQQSRRNNDKTFLDSAASPFVLAVSSTDCSASSDSILHRRLGMFFQRIVECPPRTTS